MPEIPKASAVDIVTQLVTGPSLREVATKTLRQSLRTLYPNLDIDPRLTMVVQPAWIIEGEEVVSGRPKVESLTDALVRLGLSGTTVTYLDGEDYLTQQPGWPAAVKLPVRIDAIGLLLNELAPLLFIAYKEQHVDYWDEFTYPGQPRWQQLSQALRNLWQPDSSLGWDADQIAMALAVYTEPDPQQRLAPAPYAVRACLIDLDRGDGDQREHCALLDTAVLIGTVAQRTLILTYAVTQGFQHFDSLQELGADLLQRFGSTTAGEDLKWRLVEPQGNFFDHQACALISLEADALGEISFFQDSPLNRVYPHTGTAGKPAQPPARLEPHFERLRPMLPDWLNDALPMDQTRYSRHLLNLTTVHHENHGKSFQDEVVSLQTFARNALKQQLLKEQPGAKDIKIDDIEITITSLVVWGTFVLPGHTQTQTLTLLELALQNLAGLPLGNKTVRYKSGGALPDWMTVACLEKLVSTVDIGKTYPAHLKALLIDDAEQASALQTLYTSQLRIELPLLALQHKIQHKAGIDETGYRYVVAALATTDAERHVDGEEIVIRPLAFIARRSSSTADRVANMYVIGPREANKGPCVLYRPLFDMALLQYPGHANLLYAIQHSRHLRDSVLAWLPDDVRFNYSQFVFTARLPSVWTIPQLLVNPTTALDMSGPVELGTEVIARDVPATLHENNVQALITQADRQSVSDAEARWATLKQGGWLMLNAALPFLGRSVGAAAWIWQIMDDLQEVSDVANESSGKIAWTAIADILLALGMVLAHRAAVNDAPALKSIGVTEEPSTTVHPAGKVVKALRLPDLASGELPSAHATSVDIVTALKRSPAALAALLDAFKVGKPEGLGAAVREGAHRGLHEHQKKWYAQVGERWFEVTCNEHGQVQIIDSGRQPQRAGPTLARTVGGEWVIDLRLRLRGGGLESVRQVARARREKGAKALSDKNVAFEKTIQTKQIRFEADHTALCDASPAMQAQARIQYIATLESQHEEYAANIQHVKELNLKESIPNYRTVMTERLQMQLLLGQEWLEQHLEDFRERVRTMQTIGSVETGAETEAAVQPFKEMFDITEGIINKIESAQACFSEMTLLGKDAVEAMREFQNELPDYTVTDLRQLQVGLALEVCIKPGTDASHTNAYRALESVIEAAALNIQSSLDLSADESLSNLRDRIDALSDVSEQFTAVDRGFDDLVSEYPEQIHLDRLKHLRARVAVFKASADSKLAELLRYRHLLVPQAGPSRPSASSSNRRIIQTRSRGTLVGERKKSLDGENTGLIEVRTGLTGVIATFEEQSPGHWVEQRTQPAAPPQASLNLANAVAQGQALIDSLAAFHRRIEARLKRGSRIPVEVEEEYHNQAALLRKANAAIDEALTASNLTASLREPSETLNHALDKAAKTLEEKGTSTRIRLVKQQPPTAAGVQWLKDKGEVKISKILTRRRLRRHEHDFLDEYEVRDAHTAKVLCYAHFHYSSVGAALGAFVRGHMKTVAQQQMGGAYAPGLLDNQALIQIHRSEISSRSAEALFFTPATPVATASAPF
ncbi:dermonecrotic toxin domain-containing protein [Pseudomonas moraviensis]|uniref:dermonecrotic toxin domain-containing protein n=1 Tax=Pseudomonas moraviensis TaxID=321662 RepID=UPI001059B563|nr:DUF6543 domain-containing protein [Pseudomonas moraviensis]TDK56560.1 hypothetical protein E1508_04710 [Pseudomonas moraviensis]